MTAEIRIISMGEGFFCKNFCEKLCMVISTAKIIIPFVSADKTSPIDLNENKVEKPIVIAVAKIIAIIQGLTPSRNAFTPLYLSRFEIKAAIIKMIIKEGSITPRVATKLPKTPPCELPINVAILTAIGPGVDSATAMKLSNSDSVSHPCDKTVSLITDIIPYPPPNDRLPIFRNDKNKSR